MAWLVGGRPVGAIVSYAARGRISAPRGVRVRTLRRARGTASAGARGANGGTGYASEDSKYASVLRLIRSAAAGPGGRTNPSRGAAYGDLQFGFGYGAMSVHDGGYKEQYVNRVNRKIPKRDDFRSGMVNGRRATHCEKSVRATQDRCPNQSPMRP